MKHFALSLSLAAGLLATTAVAQTAAPQTTPQNTTPPAAAATLPNAFNEAPAGQAAPRPTTRPAPVAAPAAAPDIARAETALRGVITSVKSGQIDYSAFSTDLAAKMREQSNQMGSLLNQFGDIKTITHIGQPDGTDMFRVEFTNQATEWVIGFDNEDQIAALLFRPAAN